MPSAAGMTEPPASAPTAAGSAATIAPTGRLQPITPVEEGRTCEGERERSRAASAQTRSASATPSGAHTFEILLLMTIAPRAGSFRRFLPTTTGAPGKALRVKTAAKSGVGRSSAMIVIVILAG